MSGRHAQRSRCANCNETVRVQPTRILVLRTVAKVRMWEPLSAMLCATCRSSWLMLFAPAQGKEPISPLDQQVVAERAVGLYKEARLDGSAGLPSRAPLADTSIALTASWPRDRSRARQDRWASALWK